MKKWLVGLVAAGLCAASGWAASYTWVKSADALTEGNYVILGGTADSAMKNVPDSKKRISAEAVTVENDAISDPDATWVWTLAKGDDGWTISSATANGTVYAAAPSTADNLSRLLSAPDGNYTLWSFADSATEGLIAVQSLQYTDRFLQKNNSGAFFACYKTTSNQKDLRFYKEGSAEFSVKIEPSAEFSEDFELVEGTGATLTAVAQNGEGEVSFAWTGYFNQEGETIEIPADLTEGEYSVSVTATDSAEEPRTATADFSFTVVAAPQAYTLTVSDGIENGSVAVWDGETELANPADVLEGTVLKVVATPATRTYKVESITVTGEESGEIIALENDEFTMPSENVSVTATFVERTQTAYSLVKSMDDFEAGADYLIVAHKDGSYSSALKNEYQSESDGRIALEEVEINGDNTVETEDDSIVWTIAAGTGEGQYTLYNATAAKFVSAPATSNLNAALLVDAGSDAAQWTIAIAEDTSLATIGSIYEGKSLQRNDKASNAYFANYKGGTKPYLFKKVGAGVFSIALDPTNDFDVPEGMEATITATAKNAQGEVTYTWNVTQDDTPGSAEGNVWTIPADAPAGGPWTVYCSATDGTSEADQSVSFSIVAAPVIYDVTIDETIENGTVTVDPASGVAGTQITVTATPDDGFALVSILVNGDSIEGNTFALPEGGATVGATFEVSSVKTATYTVESTSAVSITGDVPEGSEAVYASTYNTKYQLIGGTKMTLTLTGYEGSTITGLTLSMKSNGKSGAGSLSVTCGDALLAEIANAPFSAASWNGAFSSEYVDINVPVDATIDGDVVITINASANSLYCQSFTVAYEPGSPAFGITLDPAEDFDVIQEEEASVTATAKNAAGEVTCAWTVDGVAAETDGPVLALPTGELGEHVVLCVATDTGAEGVTAEASVKYTVVETPALYAVTIADDIENGSVSLNLDGTPIETPIDLLEGTEVTVVATPADGYELGAITLNGIPIEGTTFVVTGVSEVSATFTEVVDYATLPFLAEDTPYAGPWKNARVDGLTFDGLDNDYSDGAAKFIASGNWIQVKFVGTPGTLTYHLKGNSTTADCVFEVQESATGEEESWTPLATFTGENALPTAKSEFSHELSADSRYVRFAYVTKDKGNVALYDIYISSGAFSVAVDKTGFELEEGTADTVTAEAKNGAEPYAYVWTSETAELNGEGAELAIPATLATGEYAATVTVTDADGRTATADVAFTVVEPAKKFPVEIAIGILNGTVEADVDEAAEGETVTLTAIPAPGFKLGILTVSYGSENLEFTSSPATFTMPADEVLVGASFVQRGDEFVKITSVDDLEEGEYVITGAAPDGEYAMLAELSDTSTVYIKQKETPEEIEGDAIAGPEAAIVWTLAKTADGWTIHNDAIGYVGYLASDNTAGAEEEATAKSMWTISASNGLFLVQNVANTGRLLLYNASATRFACYTSVSSTSKPLAFYKKSGPAFFAVGVDKTGFELVQGETATVTAAARNGAEPYGYVWSSETEALNGEGAELAIPGTLAPGEYAATVTATDSSVEPQTATAEVAFTVLAPLPVYTVTVAEGIENGTVTVDKTEAEEGETVTVTATPAENYKLVAILVNGTPIEGNTFEIAGDSVVSAEFAEIVKHPVVIADGILNGTIEADKEEAAAGETVTLTATPADGYKLDSISVNGTPIGGTSFEMPEGDALVTASFVETVLVTFVPVESAAEFVAGEEYLVVAHKDDGFTSALKNENSGTRIGVDEVEIAADGSIAIDNDAIVWEIRAAGEGEYVLYNASAGVYAAALSDGNTAQVLEDGTDPLAQWTIDLTDAPAVKIASVAYPSRWLQRNSTPNNKYFAAYTGSQTTPALYKKAGFAVALDKEDGFTVEAGTADSITATALRGTEPYSYTWTGDLEGEGATLAIPADLAQGEYTVKVTATDSSEPALTAEKEISFTVIEPVVRYAITVAEGIVGGEVAVDKELAEAGETVTVTATPASGYELVAITVNGTPLTEGNTFTVEGDSVVSATFNEIVDYATLPFVSQDTPYSGPWQKAEIVGLTSEGLGSDYKDGSAKFDDTGDWMQIKFAGTPGSLSYGIKGNSLTDANVSTFAVLESADGDTWTTVAAYTSGLPEEGGESVILLANAKLDEKYTLSEDTRFVRFSYESKGVGNVGIYDVYISEAGAAEPTVTVTGDTALTLGGTFALELALENYTGEYSWAWKPVTIGYVDPDTATFWWEPTAVGETEVTFSAVDGTRTIASATVTLTVLGTPALVFDGDDEGTVGTPVNFTVVAEYVADPAVTFTGFLAVPEGSALTDGDVTLDFPNVSFTPDVAGDYGLVFSAGTAEGGDYVEDAWIVTVAAPPAEPEVTLVDGETTVELGDYFVLQFALSNYEGDFAWTADVSEIDEDGYFIWTPTEAGEFTVVVSAVSGEETIASATVTLTVTDEPPAPITKMTIEDGQMTLEFEGEGVRVVVSDDLVTWEEIEATSPYTVDMDNVRRYIGVRND